MIPMTPHSARRSIGARSDALKILRRIGAGSTKRADIPASQLAEILICADQTIEMLERLRPKHIAERVADVLEAAERERGAA